MADIRILRNDLKQLDPKRAVAYEKAIRAAIGFHKGRFRVSITVDPGKPELVNVSVRQPAWGCGLEGETPGKVERALAKALREKLREPWAKGAKSGRSHVRGGDVRTTWPDLVDALSDK